MDMVVAKLSCTVRRRKNADLETKASTWKPRLGNRQLDLETPTWKPHRARLGNRAIDLETPTVSLETGAAVTCLAWLASPSLLGTLGYFIAIP